MVKSRILSILLCVALLFSISPAVFSLTVDELPFSVIGENGEELEYSVRQENGANIVEVSIPYGYTGNAFKVIDKSTDSFATSFIKSYDEDGGYKYVYATSDKKQKDDMYEAYTFEGIQTEYDLAFQMQRDPEDPEDMVDVTYWQATFIDNTDPDNPAYLTYSLTWEYGGSAEEPTADNIYLVDVAIDENETGQWENKNLLLSDQKKTYLILPYEQTSVTVTFSLSEDADGIRVNDGDKIIASNSIVSTVLTASTTGTEQLIRLTKANGDSDVVYSIVCLTQKYDGMPDKVTEFLSIGSQYTNGEGISDYGIRPIRSLVGSNYDANEVGLSGPVSLGNFGGYITYYFNDAIIDDPNNPYGIDFITFGNSVEGSNEFAEPGQVWVSENGTDWYALAGAMHYEDYADWEHTITYTKNEDGTTSWEDIKNSGTQRYQYPKPEYYPYYSFTDEETHSIKLSGIFFDQSEMTNAYNNTLPPFSGFGYTDVGRRLTILDGESSVDWSVEESEIKRARNIAGNPYLGTYVSGTREFSSVTDGMDLAWAVDAQGQPVDVSGMQFHYVKIVTATNIVNGDIGEKSTEVNMVRVAQAADAPVGKTDAPAKITVDGADLGLEEGKFVYDDVVVDGPFKVEVEAPEDAHIYINNNCAAEANFDGMPLHQIVRVIVQEGEKEPVIYVLNLTETTETPEPSASLTLDANGGTVNGNATYSFKFDANMSGDPLPEPTHRNSNVTFGGWFMGQRRFDAIPDEIQDTTLTALWLPVENPPAVETIDVTFRLIGSTLATGDIDLADGDFKGATYVTWIPTTTYTIGENDTVADLFITATNAAGIQSVGADKGYVSTVYAPASLGGYALSEFTNGPKSGWMYTKNGVHTNAINTETMQDGDEIIFHYVNDYAWEVEDWSTLGGSGWPQLSDGANNYWNKWLEAADVAPSNGDSGSTGGESTTTTTGAAETDEVTLSAEEVKEAADENGNLAVETENGTVKLDEATLDKLAETGEKVVVSVKENADGTVTVDVTAGDKTIDADVKVELPVTGEGQVLVIVNPDGTEEIVKKSVVEDGKAYAELPAGATVKVIDNAMRFNDVADNAWYADEVEFASSHGLFQGVGDGKFAPAAPMTRAMLATVLYRLEDAAATGTNPFDDVADGTWYTDAVIWASAEGIVQGTGKGFDPNANVTREQIATMLYRYAKTIGLDVSGSAALDKFSDGDKTASWAKDAMQWAVSAGLFRGDDTGALNPKGDATRAEVATLLMRMVKLIVK